MNVFFEIIIRIPEPTSYILYMKLICLKGSGEIVSGVFEHIHQFFRLKSIKKAGCTLYNVHVTKTVVQKIFSESNSWML